MAKMFVLNEADLQYFPDGVHRRDRRLLMKPRWSMRQWLPALTMMEVLIDLGTDYEWNHDGEFQIWGRRPGDDESVLYPHEVWREMTYPKLRGLVLRRTWESVARKADRIMA